MSTGDSNKIVDHIASFSNNDLYPVDHHVEQENMVAEDHHSPGWVFRVPSPTHNVYLDETGSVFQSDYVIWGIVKVPIPHSAEHDLQAIATRFGLSDRELKFVSTDRSTLAARIAFLDYFFDSDPLSFAALIKSRDVMNRSFYRRNRLGLPAASVAYNQAAGELLKRRLAAEELAEIHVDRREIPEVDNLLDYLGFYSFVYDAKFVDSASSRCLQLIDLLIGALAANIGATAIENLVKRQISAHFANRLCEFGVHDCMRNAWRAKVNLWHYRPQVVIAS